MATGGKVDRGKSG